MLTVVIILYTHKWKDPLIPTMEEGMMKAMELAKMAKLIVLIKEKILSSFVLKTLLDFVFKTEKKINFDFIF